MLINSEGRPAILCAVLEDGTDGAIWHHCFGTGLVLDSKKGRAIVTAMLEAHGTTADYCQPLKKKGR